MKDCMHHAVRGAPDRETDQAHVLSAFIDAMNMSTKT